MILEAASPRVITVQLPVPPSANRYWREVIRYSKQRKSPRNPAGAFVAHMLTPEAEVYRQNVAVGFRRQLGSGFTPFSGPIILTIWWRRERRAGDLTNRIKVPEDALKGLAYDDDDQVVEMHAYRADGETPGLTVRIEERV